MQGGLKNRTEQNSDSQLTWESRANSNLGLVRVGSQEGELRRNWLAFAFHVVESGWQGPGLRNIR